MAPFNPTLSVITVVYNNVKDIERTIQSVIGQSYANIQYIIVDGGSTDGTLQVIEHYRDKISKVISEKDNGIYDAMNKGLALADGDYVLFMNSGDEIYSIDTVERIFSAAADADIYYGETEMLDENLVSQGRRRHQIPKKLNINSFKYGMSVSHQAIYVKKTIASPYNLNYKLSADIDWVLNALTKAKKITRVDFYVAKYLMGGLSKQKHWASLKERFQIFTSYYGLLPNLFNHGIIACRLLWHFLKHNKTND
ncbi:glycosyl transferase [Pelobium manganitolerans]|uniref:Glycosyl transferase n=1 Tax=Pelobium manganitolerans TaxID=1842495 RepID=A0A419SBS1_9SPHI|nr:glycosyltransferase family 2 protein [Pelobium manganitolerans]RKD20123.1 glycosyl transferase [Pelobium manganitolerans]